MIFLIKTLYFVVNVLTMRSLMWIFYYNFIFSGNNDEFVTPKEIPYERGYWYPLIYEPLGEGATKSRVTH